MSSQRIYTVIVTAVTLATSLQAEETHTSLKGRVTDELGHGLPGVAVIAFSFADRETHATLTDVYGEYTFAALLTETYWVRYKLEGFRTSGRTIEVSGKVNETADVAMEIGEHFEEIILPQPPWIQELETLPLRPLVASVQPVPLRRPAGHGSL